MRLKKILFPVEFSTQCASVAGSVRSTAEFFDAELLVLHATGILPNTASPNRLYQELKQDLLRTSADKMNRFVSRHFPHVRLNSVIKEGDPAQVIADYAHENKADLIMMPTHGYGPFRRFLIGSVTAKVLHDARCPVWTSAHVKRPSRKSVPHGYQNIICAVDSDSSAVSVIRWAGWLAQRYEAALNIVHVIPGMDEISNNRGEVQVRRYLSKRAEADLSVIMDQAGIRGDLLLRGGSISAKLAETARQQHADLMVIGRGHTRLALGRLRTHSFSIIREAPCPVLSV
jgi:nucleotide-binding universal stress UspA family protein